jgi:flagellar basal body-associated protein FliL
MAGFIEKLRAKEPEEKKKITIWTAAIITAVVAVVWAVFFFSKSAGGAPAGSFLEDIRQGLRDAISAVKK